MAIYELIILDDGGDKLCSVGEFHSEEELIGWAMENKGELEKC